MWVVFMLTTLWIESNCTQVYLDPVQLFMGPCWIQSELHVLDLYFAAPT